MSGQFSAPEIKNLKSAFQFPSFHTFPEEIDPEVVQIDDKPHNNSLVKIRSKKRRKKQREISIPDDIDILQSLDYYVDLKGDKSIFRYQSIRGQPIPEYKASCKIVLGLNNIKLISSRLKNLVYAPIESLQKLDRIKYRDFKATINSARIILNTNHGDDTLIESDKDFLKIPDEFEVGVDDAINTKDFEFQQKNIEADRLVRERPLEVSSWLSFIKLQDTMVSQSTIKSKSQYEQRIQEKKMLIVEKALGNLPDCEELLVIYLDLLSNILDSREMVSRWDAVLDDNPTSFTLWLKYIDYRLQCPSSFEINVIIDLIEECIESLSKVISNRDDSLLHVFIRCVTFLRQSGYIEKAVASFQALIEFNFFCPPHLKKQSFYQRVDEFRGFWESECPRFGDVDARGWCHTVYDDETDNNLPSIDFDFAQFDGIQDPCDRWFAKETHSKFSQWAPLRNSTQEKVDDPFQIVLFDDIRGFLFDLSKTYIKPLIALFLNFLGVDLLSTHKSDSLYTMDPFIHDQLAREFARTEFLKRDKERHVSFPLRFNPSTQSSMFCDEEKWSCSYTKIDADTIQQAGLGQLEFASRILHQSCSALKDSSFTAVALWLEYVDSPKQASQSAKILLQSDPMNLILWNVYAQIITKTKGPKAVLFFEKAIRTYHTILSKYSQFDARNKKIVGFLYGHLADLECNQGNLNGAVNALVAYTNPATMIGNDVISAPKVLLVQKLYTAQLTALSLTLNQNNYSFELELYLTIASNFCLFDLLVQSLDTAIEHYYKLIDSMDKGCLLAELMTQNLCKLVYTSLDHQPSFKPQLLRGVLEKALQTYPTNTLFLSLYGWNEGQTKLDNRVRLFINNHLTIHRSHCLVLFSVWTEVQQRSIPNTQVIRSLLSDSLETGNISIWMLAIEFEVADGKMERAKEIFYQAVVCCPWAKDIYMMAFKQLRSVFANSELEDVLRLCVERDLRIVHELD